jgi:hypothetical protein
VSPEIQFSFSRDTRATRATLATLDNFILGRELRIALEPDHHHCDMARLDPARDEVWEIRVYDQKPQVRLFGSFAAKDTFVALTGPWKRPKIKPSDWDEIKQECRDLWLDLFALNYPRLIGDKAHDYLSTNYSVV